MRIAQVAITSIAFFSGTMAASAASQVIRITAPSGSNTGGMSTRLQAGPSYSPALEGFAAQNRLSPATNQKLMAEQASAGGTLDSPGIKNGTLDTIPYFSSWFITGTRNSIYTYSMAGQSPKAGGTTLINSVVIPLIINLLDSSNKIVAVFDPTGGAVPCAPESDIARTLASPIYNAATYPGGKGLPPDTGQFVDTQMRAEFHNIRAANWHTKLSPPLSTCNEGVNSHIYEAFFNPTSWVLVQNPTTLAIGFAVDLSSLDQVLAFVLSNENSFYHEIPNSTIPVILTDSIGAFEGTECCILGFHAAQPGLADPSGVLTWIWATFFPPSGPFAPDSDVSGLSHEMAELFNDPFTNTAVSPWVDGSATFGQANLEVGDAIEAMNPPDVWFSVTVTTGTSGTQVFTVQNLALLAWFTRNPLNGGVYSWPNTHTLGQCAHVLQSTQNYCYGEGSAGFLFGPPY